MLQGGCLLSFQLRVKIEQFGILLAARDKDDSRDTKMD